MVRAALIYLRLGKIREARDLGGVTLYVLAATGDSAQVRAKLRALDSLRPIPQGQKAYALLGLRDTAAALTALERATDGGEMWYSGIPTKDAMYASVRGSRRFEALLRRIGLDPDAARGSRGRTSLGARATSVSGTRVATKST